MSTHYDNFKMCLLLLFTSLLRNIKNKGKNKPLLQQAEDKNYSQTPKPLSVPLAEFKPYSEFIQLQNCWNFTELY